MYIIEKDKEITSENYPISLLLNDRKDIFMPHATTEIIIGSAKAKWRLTPKQLLEIMKSQSFTEAYNVAD